MSAIEVQGLHKVYGATTAVEDVTLEVETGEVFGIVGPNGAGKTTTVECITGLRRPDAGRISVFGLDPQRDHARLTRHVGVQLQSALLPERITVAEAVRLYASFYEHPADGDTLIDRLGLGDRRRARFGKLSGGQQQRLAVVLALIGRPRLAVLDELTTGLDPQARRDVWSLIEQLQADGVTVLLVTHFMEEAERLCDRVALIDQGRVRVSGTPAELGRAAGGQQRMRFRVEGDFDDNDLRGLDGVTAIERSGQHVTVIGTGDVVLSVTGALARRRVVAHDLRVSETDLDDAYAALTAGDRPDRNEG